MQIWNQFHNDINPEIMGKLAQECLNIYILKTCSDKVSTMNGFLVAF